MRGSGRSATEAAATALCAIAARGAEFRVGETGVEFRPARLATEDERRLLLSAASSGLGRALAWRVSAMRVQVPPQPGPIPALLARPDVRVHPGLCVSCGELLPASAGSRCPLCSLAAWIVVSDRGARVCA